MSMMKLAAADGIESEIEMTQLLMLMGGIKMLLHVHHGQLGVGLPTPDDVHFKWLLRHLDNEAFAFLLREEFSIGLDHPLLTRLVSLILLNVYKLEDAVASTMKDGRNLDADVVVSEYPSRQFGNVS